MIKTRGEEPNKPIIENIGNLNIHKAWTQKIKGTEYPFALHPTNVHPRMSSQASRFTIHGEMEIEICNMDLSNRILCKYVIADEAIPDMKKELRVLGISHSSLFPELDGLSEELSSIY